MPEQQRIIVFDSQRLNEVQACMRKYNFMFGESPVKPMEAPDSFERGDMIHQMLKTYYVLRKYRSRWAQNNTSHSDVIRICVNVGRYTALRLSLEVAEVQWTVETFVQYAQHYENDGWDQITSVEQTGSKILYESPSLIILYEMKFDLVISLKNAPIVPVDHKTSKMRKEPSGLSNQFMGYCWGLGVNNIMINKVGFQTTLKPEEKFQRHLLSYQNDQIEEWRENAIWWIKFADAMIQTGQYPANFTSCDKYSGCIFKEVCSSDRATREWKLKTKFAGIKTWDVGADL